MYKVELLKDGAVILLKKFKESESALNYAFYLLDLLNLTKEIKVYQKQKENWKIIKKFSLKK